MADISFFAGDQITGKWLALKMALFGLVPLPALEIGEAMHRLRPALDELSAIRAPVPAKIARAIDIASVASLILLRAADRSRLHWGDQTPMISANSSGIGAAPGKSL